jgi:hypothetical protein
LIFADGFESGNFSAWTSSVTNNGNLGVSTSAALEQTYGMAAAISNNSIMYISDNSPNNETRYRARFYFNPNSIVMAKGNSNFIMAGMTSTGSVAVRIEFGWSGTTYRLRAGALGNGNGYTNTAWVPISNTTHYIEIDWRAASAPGIADGSLTFWVDGVQQANLTGVSNDSRRINSLELGVVAGMDSGTRGTFYIDAFESRRQTYIGP